MGQGLEDCNITCAEGAVVGCGKAIYNPPMPDGKRGYLPPNTAPGLSTRWISVRASRVANLVRC